MAAICRGVMLTRAGRGQCCEVHTRKTVFFLASSVLLRGGRAARTGERLPVPVS